MKWNKKSINKDEVKKISESYNIPLLTASIFSRRGIVDPEDIVFYLEDDTRYLHNPFLFEEMEDAVDRVFQAASEGEKVIIFGDRDVDGITSTVILKKALEEIGIDSFWSLPEGDEAYGVTMKAVESFAEADGSLIITVDCGISNDKEIARALELGVDTIILDHHLPSENLPPALAIVNPKGSDCGYPFPHLAGCGVAAKFVWALTFGRLGVYKEEIVLLNLRPGNETYILDAVRLVNMVEVDRISENIVPGLVRIEQTRLKDYLVGRHIFVYEKEVQVNMLKKVFGESVEIGVYDLADVLWEKYPALSGKSILQIREKSRSAVYSRGAIEEIEILVNLFEAYIRLEFEKVSSAFSDSLDLVALGTIADMMPLKGENRILVKQGMALLNKAERKGIHELLFQQNILGKKIGTTDISWQVTPVINASGRMGQPGKAVELFLEESSAQVETLAKEILSLNKARKRLGESVWEKVIPKAKKEFESMDGKMVMVVDSGIKRGITGIIASRLVNFFGVPSMVIASVENNMVGSMRSINGFKVKEFLGNFSGFFIDFGGHDYAAGFSLKKENLDNFVFAVKNTARDLSLSEKQEDFIEIDAELPLDYLEPGLIKTVEMFEPYGEGSPPLVFLAGGFKIENIEIMGKSAQQHVKMLLDSGKFKWPGIFWRAAEKVGVDFSLGDTVDVVFRLGRNYFQNTESLQLTILDVKRAGSWSSENGAVVSIDI